jgi:hypothetical protein
LGKAILFLPPALIDKPIESNYNNSMADKREKQKKPVEKLQGMHDEVAKNFLSDNETAKSFFKEYLPTEISRS